MLLQDIPAWPVPRCTCWEISQWHQPEISWRENKICVYWRHQGQSSPDGSTNQSLHLSYPPYIPLQATEVWSTQSLDHMDGHGNIQPLKTKVNAHLLSGKSHVKGDLFSHVIKRKSWDELLRWRYPWHWQQNSKITFFKLINCLPGQMDRWLWVLWWHSLINSIT